METFLIAGLGNPGARYADNRHNVGFRCLRRLAAVHGLDFSRRQTQGRIASGTVAGRSVALVLPQTFMNESGKAVAPLARFYKIPLDHLLVVYDDMDLPLGVIRVRSAGSSGGHRGIKSIIERLGSQDFARLRVGIDRPPGRMDPVDYVLENFLPSEEPVIADALDRAVAAIETWLTAGVAAAMERYNPKPSPV